MMHVNILSSSEEQRINALEVTPETTVDTLRGVISHRYGVANDPAVVRLLFSGRLLQNGRTLGSYSVRDGSSIHVVVRPGAAPSSPPPTRANAQAYTNTTGAGANAGINVNLSVLPGLLGTLAAQNYLNSAGSTDAERTAMLSNATGFLSALMGAGAQVQAQRSANQATAPSAPNATAAAPARGGETPAANTAANVATTILSNPAVSGFLSGLMTSVAGSAQTAAANPSTTTNNSSGDAPTAGVNINQGGFGMQFTAPQPTATRTTTTTAPQPAVTRTTTTTTAPQPAATRTTTTTTTTATGTATATAPAQEPIPPPPPFPITPPTAAAGTVPLTGPFLVEHLIGETNRSGVDTSAVAMGFLMGNTLSLQPLRQPFAAAWQCYKAQQRAVVFPSSAEFADRRTISLAGSEGERAYAALLSQPQVQNFVRVKGQVDSASKLLLLHGEVRKFLKSLYLRLMRLVSTPMHDMSDAQWANALRTFIVYHVGLFLERAPRWFPAGGAAAATEFLTDTVVRELQERKPNNWQTMVMMVPTMVPQLAQTWHAEYTSRMKDGDNDYECFWNYPTSKDMAIADADDRAEEGRAACATAPPGKSDDDEALANELLASTKGKDEVLKDAVAEWTQAAGLRETVWEQVEAALLLSQRSSSDKGEMEHVSTDEGPALGDPSAASSLWTEMSWTNRK